MKTTKIVGNVNIYELNDLGYTARIAPKKGLISFDIFHISGQVIKNKEINGQKVSHVIYRKKSKPSEHVEDLNHAEPFAAGTVDVSGKMHVSFSGSYIFNSQQEISNLTKVLSDVYETSIVFLIQLNANE